MRKAALLVAMLAAGASVPALAQPAKDRLWSFHLAAGYSEGFDVVDDFFDGGLALEFGTTYMPRRGHFGAWIATTYSGLDVNDEMLQTIGVRDGDMRLWFLGGGGIWSSRTQRLVNVYVALGAGWVHREIDLVNPFTDEVPGWCSPWWDFCQPSGMVEVAELVGKQRATRVGYTAKLGLTFTLRNQSQVYVDVSYHTMNSTNVDTEFLPLTVGYRW